MRAYNFAAGPSMLPLDVLEEVRAELTDFQGTGMSVTEISHRNKKFMAVVEEAEANLRSLMNISEDYAVLFVQGGATQQFAAVPLNLLRTGKADYIVTGNFAQKAYEEGKIYGGDGVKCVASSADKNFTYIPDVDAIPFSADADYVHICANNTIFGTRYTCFPDTGDVPLVADMSSDILSRPIDVNRFGVIYAGAQKNIAPAGVTIVIAKRSLMQNPLPVCPTMLRWKTQDKEGSHSLYNTPPAFPIYVANLVLRRLIEKGGLTAINEVNEYKAKLLYDFIDDSSFYRNDVQKEYRSIMNVPFVTKDKELDEKFVKEATAAGLVSLKGHRLVGGMRASIYNAMPVEGVQALVEFMKKFEKENG